MTKVKERRCRVMTGYNELREGQEFYGNGYKQGFIDALDKAFSKFDANCVYSGDSVLSKLEILKEQIAPVTKGDN